MYTKKTLDIKKITTCPICANTGDVIYNSLDNSVTKIKGPWSHARCKSSSCNLVWITERPEDKDLWKLYAGYTTHFTPSIPKIEKNTFYKKIKDAIFQNYLHYPNNTPQYLQWFVYILKIAHPGLIERLLASRFYIPYITNGSILDIGCGNGASLLLMQKYGWEGFGIDFDEEAIKIASSIGINSSVGGLNDHAFENESYDAILLNHVIEHIPNPKELFTECFRILKPGGTLVAITPNANSIGHKIFKHSWRGLEYPNHLQIFTPQSLKKTVEHLQTTKTEIKGSLQGELYILKASYQLHRYGKEIVTEISFLSKILDMMFFYIVGIIHNITSKYDEVIYVKITK
ncbi:MAG: hypothetical protein RLZZ308_118 [Candidatus Parcubacteria bacterium]|jgi:2-polyprenyl-3-methyl-5-hydroxy-6-metoxy-1,4-benzoquinol methylase